MKVEAFCGGLRIYAETSFDREYLRAMVHGDVPTYNDQVARPLSASLGMDCEVTVNPAEKKQPPDQDDMPF